MMQATVQEATAQPLAQPQPSVQEAPQAPPMDEAQVREYFKQAVRDLIREEPELLRDVVEGIVDRLTMEDHALAKAMDEGLTGEMVSEEEVRRILRGEDDGASDSDPLNH